jgi:hypothetical protein
LSKYDRRAYGLSADTWTKATKELRSYGLLEVRRVPQGGEFDYQRMRNLYKANMDRLSETPSIVDPDPEMGAGA